MKQWDPSWLFTNERQSPGHVWVDCTLCDARVSELRRQNALARNAKLERKMREHIGAAHAAPALQQFFVELLRLP